MPHETETALSKALDSIDKVKKQAFVFLVLGWLVTFAALVRFIHVVRTSDNIKTVLAAAVVTLVFAICMGMTGVMFFITRMTKRLLRAIYTASGPATA